MAFGRLLPLLLAAVSCVSAQSGFYLRDGDRVVFYGDSITDQRLYSTFTETYAVTRFPKEHFTFVHSGWGGDRVSGGGGGNVDLRLERDVFAYKPNVVTVMLGMNDGGYRAFDQSLFDAYAKGYEHIVDTLKSRLAGVRITAIQPSPYDDVTQPPRFPGGYNAVLVRYSQFVKELSKREGIDTADLNSPVVADLTKAFATDADGAKKLIPDRVHPGPAGHLLMSAALLEAWHAPALVSEVDIDATSAKVRKSKNAHVTELSETSWTETEAALPMPIDWSDASTKLAVESSNFLDALDQELLRISGLRPGKWLLKIDGHDIGSFESQDLEKGINLAKYDTPMMEQALAVHAYTRKHADLHNTRWRNIQVPLAQDNLPGKDSVMTLLDQLEDHLVQDQRRAAQPVPHKYELVFQS